MNSITGSCHTTDFMHLMLENIFLLVKNLIYFFKFQCCSLTCGAQFNFVFCVGQLCRWNCRSLASSLPSSSSPSSSFHFSAWLQSASNHEAPRQVDGHLLLSNTRYTPSYGVSDSLIQFVFIYFQKTLAAKSTVPNHVTAS